MFTSKLDTFCVICKGASLTRLPEIADRFNDCFIVNNIDKDKTGSQEDGNESEYTMIRDTIKGKNIVHFVNRLANVPLTEAHYKELGVKDVQFIKSHCDDKLIALAQIYKGMGIRTHLLPDCLLQYNQWFGVEYEHKHPNTGVLAVTYAAHIIQPRYLYVIGLDFYESDYTFRRPWQSPLVKQQKKMKDNDIKGAVLHLIKRHPDIIFRMITDAKMPKLDNLEVL